MGNYRKPRPVGLVWSGLDWAGLVPVLAWYHADSTQQEDRDLAGQYGVREA